MMNKEGLLFYNAYEDFYEMTRTSKAFCDFCREAFGEDFSQDGFSDISQVNMILDHIPKKKELHILDIGCGNGKMLGYIQKHTSAYIYGFDYSENAIRTAQKTFLSDAEFTQGLIGEIDYPKEKFDMIISMDSIYFAEDMSAFVSRVKSWLKKDGIFFVGYQEGDVMSKTEDVASTVLAKAFEANKMRYEAKDITKQTYNLLQKKRNTAVKYKAELEKEGNQQWYDLLMMQTECILVPYDEFKRKMARYIYIASK